MSVHITTQATVINETGSLDLPRILYNNLARSATVSASTEAANYPADAAQRPDTYEYWRPSALQAWWQADLGSAQSVNAIGIASHDLGTKGCTVRAQYSSNGSTWSNASDIATPDDDTPILLLFPGQSARYWRVLVDGATSPTTSSMPSLGVVYIGAVMAMQRSIYGGHAPITLNRDTALYAGLSRGGQFLGQGIRRNGFVSQVSFRYLTAAWIRSTFDAFAQSARQYPYFFAWRPGDFPDEVAYAWTDDDIKPSNMGVQAFMQASWALRGFGE